MIKIIIALILFILFIGIIIIATVIGLPFYAVLNADKRIGSFSKQYAAGNGIDNIFYIAQKTGIDEMTLYNENDELVITHMFTAYIPGIKKIDEENNIRQEIDKINTGKIIVIAHAFMLWRHCCMIKFKDKKITDCKCYVVN